MRSTAFASTRAFAIAARLAGLTIARLSVIPLRTVEALWKKFIARQFPVALSIELLEHLGRVFHLLGIDDTIVIRIEQIEERGRHAVPPAETLAPLATRSLRPAIAGR